MRLRPFRPQRRESATSRSTMAAARSDRFGPALGLPRREKAFGQMFDPRQPVQQVAAELWLGLTA